MGCSFLCDDLAYDDGVIIKLFLIEGAIPMVRGNSACAPYAIHSANQVFGETKNPFNFLRSCGGSSGGDAGLVAAKCIPFSICDDSQISAAFCGVYGFKATQGRLTSRGVGFANKLRFNDFIHVMPVA